MKAEYFTQFKADQDDYLLHEYIARGFVPVSCLLGGTLVQLSVEEERDPCATCPGPRKRCRGRPRQRTTPTEADEMARRAFAPDLRSISLLQLERAREIKQLLAEAFLSLN